MPTAVIGDERLTNNDYLESLLQRLAPAAQAPVFRFSNRSTQIRMPLGEAEVGNCFHPLPEAFFGHVVIDPAFPLFRTTMTRDLLARVHDSLEPEGELRLSARMFEHDAADIRLSRQEFENMVPVSRVVEELLVVDRRQREMRDGQSVLSAYWANAGDLVLDDVFGGSIWNADDEHAAAYFGDLLTQDSAPTTARLRPRRESLIEVAALHRRGEVDAAHPVAGPLRMHEPRWSFDESARNVQGRINSWVGYRLWGAYYKVPLLASVLRRFIDRGRPITMVEHGGDVGLIPLQLLLEDHLEMALVVNVDINSATVMASKRLRDHFGGRLRGRYRMAIAASETFQYDREYDAISFTQCLLYMRRDLLLPALQRAYDSLRSGGVLMLLENTSPPTTPGGADAELIFSPAELDGLVGSVGPLQYFRVRDGKACSEAEAEKTAVIRVLVKR